MCHLLFCRPVHCSLLGQDISLRLKGVYILASHLWSLSLQLLEFLRVALSLEQYSRLLPEPQSILVDFGLDTTTALTLHRPLLAGIQPPAVSGKEEEDGEIDMPQAMDVDMPNSSRAQTLPQFSSQATCMAILQSIKDLWVEELVILPDCTLLRFPFREEERYWTHLKLSLHTEAPFLFCMSVNHAFSYAWKLGIFPQRIQSSESSMVKRQLFLMHATSAKV